LRNTQRLDRILSNQGYGTRREIKKLVRQGSVKIDGNVAKDSDMHVDPDSCVIEVNGNVLNYRRYVYVMLNKPQGVISAVFDDKYRTVADILPYEYRKFNLFPAGRLDIDTEGLLLMTNDGKLAHELLSPKKHVPKKYYALVSGNVTNDDAQKFAQGVVLDDGCKTLPSKLCILRSGNRSEVELVIYEGKYHQVKRMFEAVGKKVLYLRRLEMGGLKLDESLKPGESRELTEEEIETLRASAASVSS